MEVPRGWQITEDPDEVKKEHKSWNVKPDQEKKISGRLKKKKGKYILFFPLSHESACSPPITGLSTHAVHSLQDTVPNCNVTLILYYTYFCSISQWQASSINE